VGNKVRRKSQLSMSLGPFRLVVPGVLAVLFYLAVFSIGLHLSAIPYRSMINQALGVDETGKLLITAPVAPAGPQPDPAVRPAGILVSGPGAPSYTPAVSAVRAKELVPDIEWYALFVSSLVYTPVNVAFLTLLAGFVGGCASNLAYEHSRELARLRGTAPRKEGEESSNEAFFLSESPFAAMLRSFLVYLAFIAGIFIAGNEPFKVGSADQYVRFATTVSVFAFIIGYDPTKFRQFVDSLPSRR